MGKKTKINAEDGKQELVITREFDLPVELLFKAYAEPEIVEQWMGSKVLKLESKKQGSYKFEKTDAQGNVVRSTAHRLLAVGQEALEQLPRLVRMVQLPVAAGQAAQHLRRVAQARPQIRELCQRLLRLVGMDQFPCQLQAELGMKK